MEIYKRLVILIILANAFAQCGNKNSVQTSSTTINPNTEIDQTKDLNIADILQYVQTNNGKLNDSNFVTNVADVQAFYNSKNNRTVWSKKSEFTALANSLQLFIEHSMEYGLFPEDYHITNLKKLRNQLLLQNANTSTILAQGDILYTDAFLQLATHLKKGRLAKDSITISADSSLKTSYFVTVLNTVIDNKKLVETLQSLEPTLKDYKALRTALPSFLATMDLNKYTYVVYPNKDSLQLVKSVMKRLYEAGVATTSSPKPDSITYVNTVTKYQKAKGLKPTGKVNNEMAKSLNTSDWYRFKRIAATLDKYKTLTTTLPETYVWVNLPSFKLKVVNHDTVVMTSKVIIGKTTNRTPELNSEISNIVLYPTWSVPYSIAMKEMLPIAKRNPGYFARRGFKVFNNRGKQVDPYSVNWSRYSKSVPFNFRQNEGGGNALGVIKFNFENPYSVYLHDTNQRYMFERDFRALSHGCVRVHLWDSVARYLITQSHAYYPNYDFLKKDSITPTNDTITYTQSILRDSSFIIADSLHRYMAKKKNMALLMQKKIPIFIRYYGCEAQDGKVVFFDDVYNEDKSVIDQYFSKK